MGKYRTWCIFLAVPAIPLQLTYCGYTKYNCNSSKTLLPKKVVAFKSLIPQVPTYFPAEGLRILPVTPHASYAFLLFPQSTFTLHASSV